MNKIFLHMVNMSFSAGYIALAIILVRKLFTKAPKKLIAFLWFFVAIRLIVPVSIVSEISLIPSAETFEMNLLDSGNGDYYINTGIDIIDEPVNDYMGDKYYEGVTVRYNFKNDLINFLSKVWIIGIVVLLVHAAYGFVRLRSMVMTATKYDGNIYMSEFVKSPFVLGILSPKIYIPYDMDEETRNFVISHEKTHIKRKDHLSKAFAYVLLCIYWFNPLLWLSYGIFSKDLELACDEDVIGSFDEKDKRAYSEALLILGTDKKSFNACPLAFGETGIKERIKGIMSYKKPTRAIIVVSVSVIVFFLVFFMTNPPSTGLEDIDVWTESIFDDAEYIYAITPHSEYLLQDRESIKNALEELKKIEINKHELSKSLAEDRPRDYMISLGENNDLCFDESVTHVWIDNSVKPSYTYRIKNPQFVKETFFDGYFTGASVTNRLKGEIITSFYDNGNSETIRYEIRNNLGEYLGIIVTPQTTLSFASADDRSIIEDITGGILWDGIYTGAYIDITPIYNDDPSEPGAQMFSESYQWIDAKEYYVAEEITVTGFDKNYFLADGE